MFDSLTQAGLDLESPANDFGTTADTTQPFTIYFAGGLFNHKELFGNHVLARYIEKMSGGRYRCVLPQDLELAIDRAAEVRNQDLLQVMKCDMAIFNFDGAELDSGTVVEMIFAKMLDIPSVVLRTDFRHGGDGFKDGDPWNLMCSAYPRSKVRLVHGMVWYQEALKAGGTPQELEERLYTKMAAEIVEDLDAVRAQKSWFTDDVNLQEIYRAALRFPGAGMEKVPNSFLRAVLRRKMAKGLLPNVSTAFIPHKAQRMYATHLQIRQLARQLQESQIDASQLLLTPKVLEGCNIVVNAVLELDKCFGDTLELHSRINESNSAPMKAAILFEGVATMIRKEAEGIKARAESLYRESSYNMRSVYNQAQVVAQEALLRNLTVEVQQVANVIAERAEAAAKEAAQDGDPIL